MINIYINKLFSTSEYENCKGEGKLPLQCEHCKSVFIKSKREIRQSLSLQKSKRRYFSDYRYCSTKCRSYATTLSKLVCVHCNKEYWTEPNKIKRIKKYKNNFCSTECYHQYRSKIYKENGFIILTCEQCGKQFEKSKSYHRYAVKHIKHFCCSRTCSARYNATHKTHGCGRSKLEKWLEVHLSLKYPNVKILFNDRTMIGSELDIYIPELSLAFELNGITHYEPIYGIDKFDKTQNNDRRKMLACAEKGISLAVIDVTSQKKFRDNSPKNQMFMDIISNIINERMASITPAIL